MIDRKIIQGTSKEIPFYLYPVYRPPPKPVKILIPGIPRSILDIDPELNMDFEDNSPYQDDVVSELYQRPDKSYFQEPQELENLINIGRLEQNFLPKQVDIDKILKLIQIKVLKETHLPDNVKEIQAGYLVSPYFKDIYIYLSQNKFPHTKTAIRKVETLAERYILLYSLLFKIINTPGKESVLLAIPAVCTDKIILLYHSSLFA